MLKLNTYNFNKPNSNTNFKSITLDPNEHAKAEAILNSMQLETSEQRQCTLKADLFELFDKHIQKHARRQKFFCESVSDYIQSLYLLFFQKLEALDFQANPLETLIDTLNRHRPTQDELKGKYRRTQIYSMNIPIWTPTGGTYDKRYDEIKTEEDLPVYESALSPEELEITTAQVQSFLQKTDLKESEKEALIVHSKCKTYQETARKLNLSDTRTKSKVHTAIAKIQNENGILPEKIKEQAKNFKKTFVTNKSIKEIENILINTPYLISLDINKMETNVKKTAELLNLKEKEYLESIMSTPALFAQKPETIFNNVKTAAEKLNITIDKYEKACLRCSTLFCLKADTVKSNIDSVVEYFGLETEQYIKSGLRQPQLFYQKPSTLIGNIENTAQILNVEPNQYAHSALRQPSLFGMKDKTVKANVSKTSKYLEISEEQFIKIALVQSQLFLQKPETILKNVLDYCKALNLSKQEFMAIAIKSPTILTQKADTNIQHIKDSSKLIGITEKEMLEYAITMPNLFSMNPLSLKEKVDIATIYKTVKGKPTDEILKAVRTIKNEDYYDIILKSAIKKQLKIVLPNKELHNNLIEIISQNNQKIVILKIPENSMTKDFTDYVENLSKEACGKNIFKFEIQNNNK